MYFDLSSVLEVHDGSSVYKCGGEGWLGSIGDRLRLIHICIDADAEDAVGLNEIVTIVPVLLLFR